MMASGGRSHGKCLLQISVLGNKGEGCQSLMAGDISKGQQQIVMRVLDDSSR